MPSTEGATARQLQELMDKRDFIAAERLARATLNDDPSHVPSLLILGAVLTGNGANAEAIEWLRRAVELDPGSYAGHHNLAIAYSNSGARDRAQTHLLAAANAASSPRERLSSLVAIAEQNFWSGRIQEGIEVYTNHGVLSEAHIARLGSSDGDIGDTFSQLDDWALFALLSVARANAQWDKVRAIGLQLRSRGSRVMERQGLTYLMAAQQTLGLTDEWTSTYLSSLAEGGPILDYRPSFRQSSLGWGDKAAAERLRSADAARYNAAALNPEIAIWKPIFTPLGDVILRGVLKSRFTDPQVVFRLAHVDGRPVREIPASATCWSAGLFFCEATVSDLLPADNYGLTMAEAGGAGACSGSRRFQVSQYTPATAVTSYGEPIGASNAVLCGSVCATTIGARYRFEYGPAAAGMSRSTPWRELPPPRSARIRERARDTVDDWVPRSSNISWIIAEQASGSASAAESLVALRLHAPFAKDRNQLNGIGSHEMPLNIGWCNRLPAQSGDPAARSLTYSAGGGELDLRDAEISVTVSAEALRQRGSILTFWIDREFTDEVRSSWSQWALTGMPFPDDAIEGDQARKTVTLRLANDPRLWTYTGNNPKEQGKRAARYRRLPLNETLAHNDSPFVLIFVFGDERKPPMGNLCVYDISARVRDHSALSDRAGAVLTRWPRSGMCDPSVVADGSRGYEESFWVSGADPQFPLEFEWSLPRALVPDRLQLNQHPHWPTKDAEVLGQTEHGEWVRLWAGVVPEGRLENIEKNYILAAGLGPEKVVAVKLRLLSGYRPDRCGIDGMELYGQGTLFTGDGEACSVSEDVSALEPGGTVFFRLVVEEDGELTAGEVKSIALPVSRKPLWFSAAGKLRDGNPPCVVLRGSAMGLETEVSATLALDSGGVIALPAVYFGCQPTGRHIYYNLPENAPLASGRLRLVARNAEGEDAIEIPWPPAR